MSLHSTQPGGLRATTGNAAADVLTHPNLPVPATAAAAPPSPDLGDQRLSFAELSQLLEATIAEPGPRIGLALCDFGTTPTDVIGIVALNWKGALTEHDVVLPVWSREGHAQLAVVRLKVRSGVEAEALADRLIARAADPIRVDGEVHRVRVHVGVALETEQDRGGLIVERAASALNRSYGSEARTWERSLSDR